MTATPIELWGTICFAISIIHTFLTKRVEAIGHRFHHESMGRKLFHILGELELVFALWSLVFVLGGFFIMGPIEILWTVSKLHYTEPLFVAVILAVSATKPVIEIAGNVIKFFGKLLPLHSATGFYFACLFFGPLLGSFITEPAAVTVTAILLVQNIFHRDVSHRMNYSTFAILLVNVSIGGTLTHFAAPPIVMVAKTWGWDLAYMMENFGVKAAVAVLINATLAVFMNRKELQTVTLGRVDKASVVPVWMSFVHLLFLAAVVVFAHYWYLILAVFGVFCFWFYITKKSQDALKIKEGVLVGLFLAGLIVLGSQQSWWLRPALAGIGDYTLYLSAMALTAITDNAALTYLGSQVPELSLTARYYLAAGAVVGGGLTLIANAPNPAGYAIFKPTVFGDVGIRHGRLVKYALLPTFVAFLSFIVH